MDGYLYENTINDFRDNFWRFSDDYCTVNTTTMTYINNPVQKAFDGSYLTLSMGTISTFSKGSTTWFRTYFLDFIPNFSALALSIISFATFIMSGFNNHEQSRAIIEKLYNEVEDSSVGERVDKRDVDA